MFSGKCVLHTMREVRAGGDGKVQFHSSLIAAALGCTGTRSSVDSEDGKGDGRFFFFCTHKVVI